MEKMIFPAAWKEWQIAEELAEYPDESLYLIYRELGGKRIERLARIINLAADEFSEEVRKKFVRKISQLSELKGSSHILSVEDVIAESCGVQGEFRIYIRTEPAIPLSDYVTNQNLDQAAVVRLGTEIGEALLQMKARNIDYRFRKDDICVVSEEKIRPDCTGDEVKQKYGFSIISKSAKVRFKLGCILTIRCAEMGPLDTIQQDSSEFQSPEMPADERTDVYVLGLYLYRLLNKKRPPFIDPDRKRNVKEAREANRRRMSGERLPMPASGEEWLAEVILKACEFKPEDRYQSIREFCIALAVTGEERQAGEAAIPERNRLRKGRIAAIGAALAAGVLALSAGSLKQKDGIIGIQKTEKNGSAGAAGEISEPPEIIEISSEMSAAESDSMSEGKSLIDGEKTPIAEEEISKNAEDTEPDSEAGADDGSGSTAEETLTAEQISYEEGNWQWEMDDLGLKLTGFNGTQESVAIPSSLEGEEVAVLGESLFFGKNVETLWIPKSVDKIEEGFFANCSNLTAVYYEGSEAKWYWLIRHLTQNEQIIVKTAEVHFEAGRIE